MNFKCYPTILDVVVTLKGKRRRRFLKLFQGKENVFHLRPPFPRMLGAVAAEKEETVGPRRHLVRRLVDPLARIGRIEHDVAHPHARARRLPRRRLSGDQLEEEDSVAERVDGRSQVTAADVIVRQV